MEAVGVKEVWRCRKLPGLQPQALWTHLRLKTHRFSGL